MPVAFNFNHIKLHGKQIANTEERAMLMSAYFLIFLDHEAFAVCRYVNVGGQRTPVGGRWSVGGNLRDQTGLQTDHLQKLVLQTRFFFKNQIWVKLVCQLVVSYRSLHCPAFQGPSQESGSHFRRLSQLKLLPLVE